MALRYRSAGGALADPRLQGLTRDGDEYRGRAVEETYVERPGRVLKIERPLVDLQVLPVLRQRGIAVDADAEYQLVAIVPGNLTAFARDVAGTADATRQVQIVEPGAVEGPDEALALGIELMFEECLRRHVHPVGNPVTLAQILGRECDLHPIPRRLSCPHGQPIVPPRSSTRTESEAL